MKTITVDDNTYSAWKKQAAAQGLSVEDWLKQKTANSQSEVDPRKPEELTVEERLERFDQLVAEIEKMNIRSEGGIDWSRDVIYGERGW